jgi:hypothetical protein
LGIGIKTDAAGIGILASSDVSVQNRIIPAPDSVPLFWYRTGSGIGILVHRDDWMPDSPAFPAFTKTVRRRKWSGHFDIYHLSL